jgi:hypothetical protein
MKPVVFFNGNTLDAITIEELDIATELKEASSDIIIFTLSVFMVVMISSSAGRSALRHASLP